MHLWEKVGFHLWWEKDIIKKKMLKHFFSVRCNFRGPGGNGKGCVWRERLRVGVAEESYVKLYKMRE